MMKWTIALILVYAVILSEASAAVGGEILAASETPISIEMQAAELASSPEFVGVESDIQGGGLANYSCQPMPCIVR